MLPPELRMRDSCNHMLGTCRGANSVAVNATAAGTFEVQATLGTLTATAMIEVE